MKKFILSCVMPGLILCAALTACVPGIKASDAAATATPQVEIANPASVYCTEQGNQLEIRTAADGSQSGVCVFPDGSTCDEWAYFRGECGPAEQASPTPVKTVEATVEASGGYMPPGTAEEITDWWGVIKSTEAGSQYDDFFERQDLGGAIAFGIDSLDPAVQARIKELRDSGKIVHMDGTLLSNVPDYNGSQVQVVRIVVENE